MTTYTISYKAFSGKAGRRHGGPYVWKGHRTFRGRLPSEEREMHEFLLSLLRRDGLTSATVKIIRHQAKGESPGFKCVFFGYADLDVIKVERVHECHGHLHKAIPGLPWSRQPWYQSELFQQRPSGRFKGTAKWGIPPKDRSKTGFDRL